MYGTYIFLANDRVEHLREYQNFFNVLSAFGGLSTALFNIFFLFGSYVNSRLFMGHVIAKLFQIKEAKCPSNGPGKTFKFTLKEKFSHVKETFCEVFCCRCFSDQSKYLNRNEIIYMKGYDTISKELDVL